MISMFRLSITHSRDVQVYYSNHIAQALVLALLVKKAE